MNEVYNVFLREVPITILKSMKNYISARKVRKKTKITESHQYKLIRKFEEMGLITCAKKDRGIIIELTDDGRELITYFRKIERKIKKLKVIE